MNMITAKEARKATEDRIRQIAKEFLINGADGVIQNAIHNGKDSAVLDLTKTDISNIEKVGPEIVKLLKDKEFDAEFFMTDNASRFEAYVIIKW